ncbi:hypothetical protein DPX39_050020800 [Trypanosoma brucei equiperdum]|uniref:Fibrous sheath-interacting protein 1 n=1 Tax=Trypanosoma brucei equiperdum TaxID=630700 RepID=A0A3L6L8A8_9TRYP|nr:hypothetical protein DPX39_050020800 [Trypanosoma brucei equiperdum]
MEIIFFLYMYVHVCLSVCCSATVSHKGIMSDAGCVTSRSSSDNYGGGGSSDSGIQSPINSSGDVFDIRDVESPISDQDDDAIELQRGSTTSRVFMQALTNRLLTQMEGDGTETLDFTACDSSSGDDFVTVMNTTTATTVSVAPSLSLSSLARAEQLLQKSVTLVNGGQHITLTKEDLERLRDSRLLHFLEANSATFVKHLHGQGQGRNMPSGKAAGCEENAEVKTEAEKVGGDADPFVNVMDDDGVEYRIYTDKDGKLLVPVNAEDEGGDEDVEEEEEEEEGGEESAAIQSRTPVESVRAASATEKSASSRSRGGRIVRLKKAAKPFVRGIGLTAEEDRRVMELLKTDFTNEPSPYDMDTERAEALEERLRWFREVRGPLNYQKGSAEFDGDDTEDDIPFGRPSTGDTTSTVSVKAIGNSYMREARDQRVLQVRLKSINTELAALQRLQRLEALCPTAGVEHLVGIPRPEWSKEVPPPLGDDIIRQLLEEAQCENKKAQAKGEKRPLQNQDEGLSYLQEKLRLAASRVEALLPQSPTSA